MEPVGGIEPPSSVYKTVALPLSYTGVVVAGVGVAPTSPAHETGALLLDHPAVVETEGIEPSSPPCKGGVLPLNYIPESKVVERDGIEPPSPVFQAGAKTTSATAPMG